MEQARVLQWVDQSMLRISSRSYLTSHYISPLFQRRSVTSYGEFPSIPHVRSRSARLPTANLIMPRNHVSIARFYDWSEDLGDCISVSRLYRDLANIPRLSDRGRGKNGGSNWCSNGVRITPGRMFSREKGALTKGEKEIIEGIYRNRSDTARDGQKVDSPVRSHHEAWSVPRPTPREKEDVKEDIDEFKVPNTLFIKSNSINDNNNQDKKHHLTCILCAREKSMSKDSKSDEDIELENQGLEDTGFWQYEGPTAPPTTPDKILHKRGRVNDNDNSEDSFLFDNPESDQAADSPRKVMVNVYLPAVGPEQSEDDIKACLLHGKSLLQKERPLSQSDFKHGPDRLVLSSQTFDSKAGTSRRVSRILTSRDVVAHTPRDVVAHTPRDVVAHTPRDVVAHTPREVFGAEDAFRVKVSATPLKLELSE